jgi:hypothetical protein
MTWDDVDQSRMLPGLPHLRGLLAEVEEAAWAEAEEGRSLDDAIRADYQVRVQEAAERLRPSLKGTAVGMTIGVVLGLVTGPLAPVVGVGVGAALDLSGAVAGRLTYRRSWLAAANDLSRRHKPG